MIIEITAPGPEHAAATGQRLEELAHQWGHGIETISVPPAVADRDDKVVDPVALAALILSIPSAAVAALDLADRIHKRRRAQQLIDHAQALQTEHITIQIRSTTGLIPIANLDPDQLLELATDTPDTK